MIRKITGFSLLATALLGMLPMACKSGGVGDPCVPEDEYSEDFPGYQLAESNAEAKSFQCETRLCLVDHFQGRVSCKYGQALPTKDASGKLVGNCSAPDDKDRVIRTAVDPQVAKRTADKAVYCSCRCDGKDKNARYCKCPSGFSCEEAIVDTNLGQDALVGSYCIKNGAKYEETLDTTPCAPTGYPATGSNPTCGAPEEG